MGLVVYGKCAQRWRRAMNSLRPLEAGPVVWAMGCFGVADPAHRWLGSLNSAPTAVTITITHRPCAPSPYAPSPSPWTSSEPTLHTWMRGVDSVLRADLVDRLRRIVPDRSSDKSRSAAISAPEHPSAACLSTCRSRSVSLPLKRRGRGGARSPIENGRCSDRRPRTLRRRNSGPRLVRKRTTGAIGGHAAMPRRANVSHQTQTTRSKDDKDNNDNKQTRQQRTVVGSASARFADAQSALAFL